MNLYFAGYEESAEEKDDILLDVIFNRLYAYNKMMNWKNEHMYDNGFRTLMLDSGAAGKDADKIDLDKYIHYCKHNRHKIKYFVNLDIIPRGCRPHGPITEPHGGKIPRVVRDGAESVPQGIEVQTWPPELEFFQHLAEFVGNRRLVFHPALAVLGDENQVAVSRIYRALGVRQARP